MKIVQFIEKMEQYYLVKINTDNLYYQNSNKHKNGII